jgi:hypothetical protein
VASPAAPQEALRMPRRLPAACCSAATSSSIPGPRNSPPRPCRPPAAPAYSRPHLRGRCRVLDSGGTAYGNDQDQQFDVQGPCDSANKPARTGNVSSGGLPPQFVGDFCLLAVPQSLKLGQARAGCPGAGTRVLPFRKSLHTARSRTRMPIRVPVQSRPMGAYPACCPSPPPLRVRAVSPSCCWPCPPRWNARPGDLGRLDERA